MAGEGGVHTIEKNNILHMEKETVTIVLAGNDDNGMRDIFSATESAEPDRKTLKKGMVVWSI